MSKRKTISVDLVVDKANAMLATSTCSAEVRQGVINLLEDILMETGNYKGFRYLLQDEVPAKQLPGVNYENGLPHKDYELRFKDTDCTRVQY